MNTRANSTEMPSATVSFRLTEEEWRTLALRADREQHTVSQLVRLLYAGRVGSGRPVWTTLRVVVVHSRFKSSPIEDSCWSNRRRFLCPALDESVESLLEFA